MPQPDAAFFDRALAKAAQSGTRRQRNRWVMTGFGGAMAAALVLWIVSGTIFETPEFSEPSIASIAMVIEEPRTVNLVFSSATPLTDATMTDGFSGAARDYLDDQSERRQEHFAADTNCNFAAGRRTFGHLAACG